MFFQFVLLATIILLPLFGAGLVYWVSSKSAMLRNYLAASLTIVTLILTSILYCFSKGEAIVVGYPFLSFAEIRFSINPMSALLAFLTAFIWTAATLYSFTYLKSSSNQGRFYAFLLLAFSANLGVFLAGNFLTLFIFFEILGISAYPLIVHNEDKKAFKAGAKYLVMVFLGDIALLMGILLYCKVTGNIDFATGIKGTSEYIKFIIFALMGIGFGVKAGVIPFHIWLPDAHPVAPTPASALLSGVMIKVGVYGIIRSLFSIFGPEQSSIVVGSIVIWVGIITMLGAVFMALLQDNAKSRLAYHSISQMGYMVLGVGGAAYLGVEGALALGGSMYHIVNHALFKSCLFLTVGAVYYRTGELNMYKLGGLVKKMPIVAFCTLVASLGISGVPLFNGYASKTLIHQALAHLGHGGWVGLVNVLFIVTCGGTIASFIKLFTLVFLGRAPKKYEKVKDASSSMLVGIMALAIMVFALGIFPGRFWTFFILPLLKHLGYTGTALSSIRTVNILTLHDIQSLVISLAVGIFIFTVGTRYGLFHLRFPRWFGVNYWFEQFALGVYFLLHEESHLIEMHTSRATREIKEMIAKKGRSTEALIEGESYVLRSLIFISKRHVKKIYLRVETYIVARANYIIKSLWSGFLAKTYRSLSASETKKEFNLYIEDLNFSIFLILFLLVLCFVSIKLIG